MSRHILDIALNSVGLPGTLIIVYNQPNICYIWAYENS